MAVLAFLDSKQSAFSRISCPDQAAFLSLDFFVLGIAAVFGSAVVPAWYCVTLNLMEACQVLFCCTVIGTLRKCKLACKILYLRTDSKSYLCVLKN